MDENTTAVLLAYIPGGMLRYDTKSFEEVFTFKKICRANNIEFSVHFNHDNFGRAEYKQNKQNKFVNKVKSVFKRNLF